MHKDINFELEHFHTTNYFGFGDKQPQEIFFSILIDGNVQSKEVLLESYEKYAILDCHPLDSK